MKLLRCIPILAPEAGGTATALVETSRALVDAGCTLEIGSLDAPNAKTGPLPESVRSHRLGPGRAFYGYCPRFRGWLREHICEFDAVIVEGCWQYPGLAVWEEARRAGVPYFVFPHGMLDPWFKRRYPLKHLKKWLYWPWAEYRVLRDAQAVLFTTEQERLLARESFRLYRVRERVVPFGIRSPEVEREAAVAAFRQSYPGLGDRPFLLFLGRIYEKKGVDLLLESWRSSPLKRSHQLVLAGPIGDERFRRLMTGAIENGGVTHIPMLSGEAKWGALAAAEALVLPSHQENFGLVIPEALAMGTPVLITHPVNIAPIVEEAGCGVVGEDTPEGVGDLLGRWDALGPEGRAAMATKARPAFEEHFDLSRRGAELAEILREEVAAFRAARRQ